jgi:hypothetical protein
MDNEQQVVNNWLLYNSGYSVGISDCLLPMDVRKEIREIIVTKLVEAAKFLKEKRMSDLSTVKCSHQIQKRATVLGSQKKKPAKRRAGL